MGKLKCYKTRLLYYANPEFKEKYQIREHDNQFDIVCMTTSYKKANEIAKELGLGTNVFRSNFTYVLTNPELIRECEKHGGFIIETKKRHNCYVSIQEALRK